MSVARRRSMSALDRSGAKRALKPTITVYCEGESTEYHYLNDFQLDHRSHDRNVKIIRKGSRIEEMVKEAIERLESVEKSKTAKDAGDSVWCVFDDDERPKIADQRMALEREGVQVAFSNPCFELWALYHFRPSVGVLKSKQAQKELQSEKDMTSYDHERGARLKYEALKPRYEYAVSNAKNARLCRERDGDPHGNPSTTVHLLLEEIRRVGRDPDNYSKPQGCQ
jgi:hypothetical protein